MFLKIIIIFSSQNMNLYPNYTQFCQGRKIGVVLGRRIFKHFDFCSTCTFLKLLIYICITMHERVKSFDRHLKNVESIS